MGKYVDITLKDKSWIFNGSVKTFTCSPTETCGNCGGNGRCPDCHGQGETRCEKCGGRGELRCPSCRGGGRCHHCGGSGVEEMVNGVRKCYFCNGSGACKDCHGSGIEKCYSCNGKGFIRCSACYGSGNCSVCGGCGEVTCRRCQGTGFYQQYLEYTAHYCVRQFCHPGPTPELINGLRLATGEELYKAVCKLWRKEGIIAFDDTGKNLKQLCDTAGKYKTHAEEFKAQYEQTHEMQDEIPSYMPFKNTLTSSKVPATRIKYEINGTEYEMVLLGDNGVVCYDDLPQSIKAFEMSRADRIKQDRFARHRHKDLAKLTAYVFNLDGINPEESSNLNLIMKHMCLNANKRDRRMRYYSYRYTPEVPYDAMIKKMKYLLLSKKTISYVWQCIAVDREITPKEQEFFDRLVEQCNIPESDLTALKRFSSKFATLDRSEFVKEYLDSGPVTLERNLDPLWFGGMVVGVILFILGIIYDKGFLGWPGLALGIGSFICYRKIAPPDQKYVKRLYELVSEEPDFDRAYIEGGNIFVRFGYGFVDGVMKLAAKIGIAFDRLFYSNNSVSKHETIGNNRQIEKSRPAPASSVAKVQSPNVADSSRQTTQSKEETTVLPQVGAALVETPTKKSNKKPLIIGIIATLVILSALGAFYFIKVNNQKSIYEKPLQEQQARHETELGMQSPQQEIETFIPQQEAQQNKLKGYEWLEGVWVGTDEYGSFGRVIVTDSYFQVVNSNMDDASDHVEDMPKQDYELKTWQNAYDGYDDDGEVFGFSDFIGVDAEKRCIYIIQGEYSALTLHKINASSFESAVYEANHNYPAENDQDMSNESYQQNDSNGSRFVVIDGSELRLRLGPSTSSETFKWPDGTNRHPNVGDKFKYLGESGDFYKIDFNGNEVWVSKQYSHIDIGKQTQENSIRETGNEKSAGGYENDEIYQIVEEMPSFPGGEQKLLDFLSKNTHYPSEAREQGIHGRVFVGFVVEPDGSISNVKLLRGIGGGCDEEAVRAVQSLPKWNPGKQKGKSVRVSYMLPINFN